MTPDVSVIIACWNAADFVGRAVVSAIASQGVTLEIIAVDDASQDATWNELQRLAASDSRIRAERLATNGGPSAARNRALELARGRYVAVLDADDGLEPARLARLVRLADETQADIVVDNLAEVDATGGLIGDGRFLKGANFAARHDVGLSEWVAFNQPMKDGDCMGYLKPLIRRAALEKHGVRYDPALRNSEDYYLVAELLVRRARMVYTPETGYRYTRSTTSLSYRLTSEQTRAWLTAETRFAARHASKLRRGERAALARRLRALKNVDMLVSATEALKARRPFAVAGLLTSDLRAGAVALAMLGRIAVGKIGRSKRA